MKTLLPLAGLLGLAAILRAAAAQAPATPSPAASTAAKTAARRAAAYQGPKVVKDSKALGHKLLRDSKPIIKPTSPPVSPIKQ